MSVKTDRKSGRRKVRRETRKSTMTADFGIGVPPDLPSSGLSDFRTSL